MAGGKHNAEDVVQDAFCNALTYWDSYDEDSPFANWFGRILQNCLKKSNRDVRNLGMALDVREEDLVTWSPDPFMLAVIDEIRADVEKLPEDKREVINLSFFNGYSPKDISEVVEMNISSIWKVISLFRREVREKYA